MATSEPRIENAAPLLPMRPATRHHIPMARKRHHEVQVSSELGSRVVRGELGRQIGLKDREERVGDGPEVDVEVRTQIVLFADVQREDCSFCRSVSSKPSLPVFTSEKQRQLTVRMRHGRDPPIPHHLAHHLQVTP